MRRSGLNALGILFGILSILIVITVAAILLGRMPFRLPFNFNIDTQRDQSEEIFNLNSMKELMEDFEEMFSGNSIKESGDEIFEGRYDKIEIENVAGEIDIKTWDEDYVMLEYTKMAPTEEHLNNLIPPDETIRTRCCRRRLSRI